MSRGPVDPDDPKGLIRESFRIDGITASECRTILVDWALSLPLDTDQRAAAQRLAARHGPPEHPMRQLLADAAHSDGATARRRGGRAARMRDPDAPGSDA